MKTRTHRILAVLGFLLAALPSPAALFLVTNVSTLPNTFECYLTSTNIDCNLGTNPVPAHMMMYRDDKRPAPSGAAGLPVPVIRVQLGTTVICHYRNALTNNEEASIHWHGIELDNDSDGTAATQDAVLPGQSYNYQFTVTRPGLFWFHSHMVPGSATYGGMYGVIIIANTSEPGLISSGVLPAETNSFTLALSDISVNPTNGMVGKQVGTNWYTLNQLISACHNNPGNGNAMCGAAGNPGANVLVNGQFVDPVGMSPMFTNIPSGTKIRLRLLNESLSRNFRMSLLTNGHPNLNGNLYRIGGQGGLLEYARLEGGIQGTNANPANNWNTLYNLGEINIGSGAREDVIITPTGSDGDIIQLVGNPLPAPYNLSQNLPANYPIAYFKIKGTNVNLPPITNGTPILAGTSETIVNLKTNLNLGALTNPAAINMPGTNDSTIHLQNGAAVDSAGVNYGQIPNVDGYAPELDGNAGNGDFLSVPRVGSTRYARVGDLLQLRASNETSGSVHPFHLHGFSMQPVRMINNANSATLYWYNYNEFVDTVDILQGQTLEFRILLEDRPRICDNAPSFPPGPVVAPCTSTSTGGALGRWVYHCHIFLHGEIGMVSELDVIGGPPPPQQTNFTSLPQLTTNGIDILATSPSGGQTVADDFYCASNTLITGVSIWGSWTNDVVDTNVTFELKFWSDVAGTNTVPARPGWQSWRQLFGRGTYTSTLVASNIDTEKFYDTAASNIVATDTKVFRYDFAVPPSIAYLAKSNQYTWMSVTAYATNRFGWKTAVTNNSFRAPAAWSPTLIGPHWSPLFYPGGSLFAGTPMNTAFQLTTPSGAAPNTYEPPPAAITPVLSYNINDGQISISWLGSGVLQYADDINGPWHDLNGVSSPYIAPLNAPKQFYRVVVP